MDSPGLLTVGVRKLQPREAGTQSQGKVLTLLAAFIACHGPRIVPVLIPECQCVNLERCPCRWDDAESLAPNPKHMSLQRREDIEGFVETEAALGVLRP